MFCKDHFTIIYIFLYKSMSLPRYNKGFISTSLIESKVAVPVYNETEIGTATDKCG